MPDHDAPTRADRPADPRLPGFDELLFAAMPGPVAAIYETAGSRVQSHRAIQATWRPGRSLTMRYRVEARGGRLSGSHDIVAVVGDIPDGASLVAGPDGEVGVWVVPDDPNLPGMRSALDLGTVRGLLADLGAPDEPSSMRLRAYRPGRRAVVEVVAGGSSLFLKVVRPSRIEALHDKHRFLSEHLPVPDSLGVAPELGIVVMRSLPGSDLRTVLRSGSGRIPGPGEIAAIPRALPDPLDDWRAWSPEETLGGTVELLVRLLPEEGERLRRLADEIGEDSSDRDVPVHGDFHEAQILIDRGRLTGLIDVDTFGWGRSGDDAATMLAHLHLLAPGGHDPARVVDLARGLNQLWDQSVDPTRLRLKTAAHVLGLATGPFRVQSDKWREETRWRIDVAEQWVKSARRVHERSLIGVSGRSHDQNPG